GGRPAGGEQRQVDTGEVGGGGVLHLDLLALPGQRGAGRARGREVPDPADGEVPLLEQPPHHSADLAGGADDRDGGVLGEVHGPRGYRPCPTGPHRLPALAVPPRLARGEEVGITTSR